MKAKYKGQWSVEDIIQTFFDDRETFFRRHGITHVQNLKITFVTTDERGEETTVYHSTGEEVIGYIRTNAYPCAAQYYEESDLEAVPTLRSAKAAGSKQPLKAPLRAAPLSPY